MDAVVAVDVFVNNLDNKLSIGQTLVLIISFVKYN